MAAKSSWCLNWALSWNFLSIKLYSRESRVTKCGKYQNQILKINPTCHNQLIRNQYGTVSFCYDVAFFIFCRNHFPQVYSSDVARQSRPCVFLVSSSSSLSGRMRGLVLLQGRTLRMTRLHCSTQKGHWPIRDQEGWLQPIRGEPGCNAAHCSTAHARSRLPGPPLPLLQDSHC